MWLACNWFDVVGSGDQKRLLSRNVGGPNQNSHFRDHAVCEWLHVEVGSNETGV